MVCHLRGKESKGKFFGPEKLENHTNEGKENEKTRKSEEEENKTDS